MQKIGNKTWSALRTSLAGFELLEETAAQNSYAHAYLIQSWNANDRELIAELFLQSIVCVRDANKPCRECENCVHALVLQNPDVLRIAPKSLVLGIGIDEVRAVHRFVNLTGAGKKIVVIQNAGLLTLQAANALLKVVEEPPQNVIILLTAGMPHSLPATLTSRCVAITVTQKGGARAGNGHDSNEAKEIEKVLSEDVAFQCIWLDGVIKSIRKSGSAQSDDVREYVLSLVSSFERLLRSVLYDTVIKGTVRSPKKNLSTIRRGLAALSNARGRIQQYDNPQLALEHFFIEFSL